MPGKDISRFVTSCRNRCWSSAFGYLALGKDRSKASVCFVLKPGSVASKRIKLRKNKPAPINRTIVNANSATTSADCERRREADNEPRSDSFRTCCKSGLLARSAGHIPNNNPQPHETRSEERRVGKECRSRRTAMDDV